MAITVVGSHTDQADGGPQGTNERRARSRMRTVVTYLQNVDGLQQRSRCQELFHGRLRIAREERRESSDL